MSKEFDVCIIGSGAAGGIMAKELCDSGAKVVMLGGGRRVDPSEFLSHKWPYESPFRNFRGERQAMVYYRQSCGVRLIHHPEKEEGRPKEGC